MTAATPWPERLAGYDLGGVRIDALPEQQSPVFDPARFFRGVDAGMIAAELADGRDGAAGSADGALDGDGMLVLAVTSWVIRDGDTVVVVDTGVGNGKHLPNVPAWHELDLPHLPANLARLGLASDDVDLVVATHLHSDHVGWHTMPSDGAWAPMFPRARYVVVADELAHWRAVHATTPLRHLDESVLPLIEAGRVDEVAADARLTARIRLQHTGGHTPGHCVVRVEGDDRAAVILGDLVHSPLQLRRPELEMVLDVDPAHARAERRRLLEESADDGVLLCTAHFPLPGAGTAARLGAPEDDRFRFLPEG